ncbi:hypothetical protein CEB3_c12830 [Peptococcaceae bacterium CEB3]|nr:hypothetical protein CEB3_c12830 [Peptococcaceae bacterium CEB3]
MRILADTNILISALLWPNSRPAKALLHAVRYHTLVLCDRNLFEFWDVLKRKAPQALQDAEVFLAELSFELIPGVENGQKLIRDVKDKPILNAAIVAEVDIIVTGDKDFLSLNMEHPRTMTVAQYLEQETAEG